MKISTILLTSIFILLMVSIVYADDNWDRPLYQFNDSELKQIISDLNMTFYTDINNLQIQIDNIHTNLTNVYNTINTVNTSLWNNFQYYYTQTEINNIFTNYYNKTEIDLIINTLNTSLENQISSVNITLNQAILEVNNSFTNYVNTTNNNLTELYQQVQDVNNSILFPNGSYFAISGNQFYINESHLNITINDITQNRVLYYNVTINTTSGFVEHISPSNIRYLITEVKVIPTTPTNTYRFQLTEYPSNNLIDKDRIPHNGVWDIEKNYAIDSQINITITNAVIDEPFNVLIKYLDNGVVI